ncbi:MAG: exodeoxyribonuclease III [Bacteroidales bacterium]|nr:exodeoxyribonuclease III [Bacteroidales bacterium]
MKLISWNVNGLRAALGKGCADFLEAGGYDCICLQETKLSEGLLPMDLPGYNGYLHYAQKKGYSGTAIYTRREPMSVRTGIGVPEFDAEGRAVTLEFPEFWLVTVYVPNSQRGLARLDFRLGWEAAIRKYLTDLQIVKPVVVCGDLNVAAEEIDIHDPKGNRRNAGFSDEERAAFRDLKAVGLADVWREANPETRKYSWWAYWGNARAKNLGWRIDYFLVSRSLAPKVTGSEILDQVEGSDHCPVTLELDI